MEFESANGKTRINRRGSLLVTTEDSISKEGWHALNWLLSSSIGLPGAGKFPLRHFPCALPSLSLSLSLAPAIARNSHRLDICAFPLHPFSRAAVAVSSPPPPPRGLREIPEFRASVAPPPPSRRAKSFFKLRLDGSESETGRQRGKKLSRREPLGLFPTSSAVQTRCTTNAPPTFDGFPISAFPTVQIFRGIWLSLPSRLSPIGGRNSHRDSH